MADIIVNVALEVAKCLLGPIGHGSSYLQNYTSNFENLNIGVEKLMDARESMQNKVVAARQRGDEIEKRVEKWLISVDKMIDEAEKLIKDEEKGNKKCFKGLFPNLKKRYQLSKKATIAEKVVVDLKEEAEKFDQISHRTVPEEAWLISNKGYEVFESRKSALTDILNTLSNPNVDIIGVYGMGGVGKTTVVKEVARQAKEDKLFDEVVFAEVSQTPNIKKIQGEIADKLGLQFHEETQSGRARRLYARLSDKRKILVILDNIWKYLNLETIGIPYEDGHSGCKVLLTARDRNVLLSMGSEDNFLIGVLNEEETWRMFKKMVGDSIENRDLESVAVDVVNECGGLPIAIVTVSSALRNKSVYEWKNALRQLRRPCSSNFTGVLAKAYSTIELSYDCLRGEELQQVFLLCSLMRYHASILDLLKYGIGLGIFKGIYTLEEARNKVYTLVHELKDCCLLLDGYNSEWFSMHDVVRDVAISIATRNQHVFSVRNEILCEWPDQNTLKKCTAISIRDSNISELHEGLECPQLEFFFMKSKDSFFKMPENFFAGMGKLRVLDFTRMQLLSLSSSLHLLVNLQTLCLDYGTFEDVAIIGELKELKILSLQGSSIKQLPREISKLSQLKLLDLRNCSKLKVIQPNVISSLSGLEELYISNSFAQWEVGRPNIGRSNASLDELKNLSRLTTLEIDIKDDKIIPRGLFSKELKRYKILMGDGWSRFGYQYGFSRMLKLKLTSKICLEELQGFKSVEYLCLDEFTGAKNVLYELDGDGFSQLKNLHVQNNPHFLCIVDSMTRGSCEAFPVLETLFLSNLISLEKICHGQLTAMSFCKLKVIKVEKCHELKSIFSFSSIGKCLPQVEHIEMTQCKNMEEIFVTGREKGVNSIEVVEKIEFCQLHLLTLRRLPQLRNFSSREKTPSTSQGTQTGSLFNEEIVLPNLEALELSDINVEKIWYNKLSATTCSVQNLTRLIVRDCGKLAYIFSSSMVECFQQLRYFEICNCSVLEEIVSKEGGQEANVHFVFPRVTFVRLCDLPELKTFYPGIHTSEWPMLEKSEVFNCDKLEYSFQNLLASKNLPRRSNLVSQRNRNHNRNRNSSSLSSRRSSNTWRY